MFLPQLEEKKLKFEISVGALVPEEFEGDEERFIQIIQNLMSNAVKFTNTGAIQLKLGMEGRRTLQINVIDTGVGMNENEMKNLFVLFGKNENLENEVKVQELADMGLTISQLICNNMGCTLNVKSTQGKGTRFFFNLNRRGPTLILKPKKCNSLELDEDRKETLECEVIKPLKRVCVVADDNEINRFVLKRLLNQNYPEVTVYEAVNGKEVVSCVLTHCLNKDQKNLVFMDLEMPEMDGIQATRKLRNLVNPEFHLCIVAMTAHTTEQERTKCDKAGMNAFYTKPVSLEQLRKIMKLINQEFMEVPD